MPGKYVNGSRDETGFAKSKVLSYNENNPFSGDSPLTVDLNNRFDNNGQPIYTGMRQETTGSPSPGCFSLPIAVRTPKARG